MSISSRPLLAAAAAQSAPLWMLGDDRVGPCDQFCIERGDPVLDVLARY